MAVVTSRALAGSEVCITWRLVEVTYADQPVEPQLAVNGQAGLEAWEVPPGAPAHEVARLVVADVFGRFVREEIGRRRLAHVAD